MDWQLFARFAGPALAAVVGAVLARWWQKKVRLTTYLAHASAVSIQPPQGQAFQVNTHSIVVRNAGQKAATNVRLGHHVLPNYSVYPAADFEEKRLKGGGVELLFPTLVPSEQITVTYLYYPPVFWQNVNSYTKSDEGFAKVLSVLPAPQPPQWVVRSVRFLVVVGSATVLYALAELGLLIWRRWFGV